MFKQTHSCPQETRHQCIRLASDAPSHQRIGARKTSLYKGELTEWE